MSTWIIYQDNAAFGNNNLEYWNGTFQFLRIVGWYMIIVFYCWTLIAAKLYPQQDFGIFLLT
jgi:hypothetical protein